MITVNEIMSENVITLKASENISAARKIMNKEHIRHMPVVDDSNYPVGIITHRDILRAQDSDLSGNNHSIDDEHILLADIMSREISYVLSQEPLRVAGLKLQKNKFGCLPVMEKDKLVGIITDYDFVGIAINLLEQMEHSEDY